MKLRIQAFFFLTYLYTSWCVFQRYVPRCPSYGIERILKARGVCSSVEKYHCLYDDIWNLAEVCLDYKQIGPGTYPRYNSFGAGNIDSDQCNSSFYQSRFTKSYQTTNCLSLKSKCSGEGQVLCDNGTTQTDVTCGCDHTQGYASMTQGCCSPTGMNDCSCYKKLCPAGQELDKDYDCVNKCSDGYKRKIGENLCTPISNVTTGHEQKENEEVIFIHNGLLDHENIKIQIIFDLSTPKVLLIIDAAIYIVLTISIYVLGYKFTTWRPFRYKLVPFTVLSSITFGALVSAVYHLYTEKETQMLVSIVASIFAGLMFCVFCLYCFIAYNHEIAEECYVVNEKYDKRVYQYINAAKKGELEEIKRLKNEDYIDMEEVDYDKRSALHLAACNLNLDVVEYLLKHDFCFPFAKDRWNRTAIEDLEWHVENKYLKKYIEMKKDDIDKIKSMINNHQSKGISKQHFREKNALNLIQAAEKGDLEAIKRLHKQKCDMNLPNSDGKTALHAAAKKGDKDVVEYLIKYCEVSPFVRFEGKRPVELVSDEDIRTILTTYMTNCQESTKQRSNDENINMIRMFNSAASGDLQQLKLLRRDNPKILYKHDYDMRTALHVAVSENQEHIISFLLEDPKQRKMAVETMDRWNMTPFDASKLKNREEAYHAIINNCPGLLDTENDEYRTCILLNAAKMKTGVKNKDGETGLKIIKKMHDRKVDLNLRDYDGRTALHVAAAENNVEVVNFLVNEALVVVDIPDRDGRRPKKETTSDEIKKLIENQPKIENQHEVVPLSVSDINVATIMKWALQGKLKSQMKTRRYEHLRLDCIDHMKNTPLHVSTDKCQIEDVKYLLNVCHVSPFPRNSLGQTPLELLNLKIDNLKKKEEREKKRQKGEDKTNEEKERKRKFEEIRTILTTAINNANKGDVKEDEQFKNHTEQERIFLFLNKAYKGDIKAIRRYLMTDGNLINKVDYDDRSALHIAAEENHGHLVKFLIEQTADVNKEDRWNATPMIDTNWLETLKKV